MMQDARLWIAMLLLVMVAGCAEMGSCGSNACSEERSATAYSVNGCGVVHEACLDTGTIVRPAR